jgi:hypothetical protein
MSEGAPRGRAVIAWIVAPMVGIAFFPTLLLMVIGMAPAIVAFFIDKRPRKVTARAVAYLNIAGCLPFALDLWSGQNTITGVMEIASDPSSLMIMYSAAAVGWTLNFITAPIMSAYLAVQHEAKGRSIENRKEELIKEWGADVKGQVMAAVEAQQPPPPPAEAGEADDSETFEEEEEVEEESAAS